SISNGSTAFHSFRFSSCRTCPSISFLSPRRFFAERIASCRSSRDELQRQSLSREFVSYFYRSGLRFCDRAPVVGSARSLIGSAEWTRHSTCFHRFTQP